MSEELCKLRERVVSVVTKKRTPSRTTNRLAHRDRPSFCASTRWSCSRVRLELPLQKARHDATTVVSAHNVIPALTWWNKRAGNGASRRESELACPTSPRSGTSRLATKPLEKGGYRRLADDVEVSTFRQDVNAHNQQTTRARNASPT